MRSAYIFLCADYLNDFCHDSCHVIIHDNTYLGLPLPVFNSRVPHVDTFANLLHSANGSIFLLRVLQ